MPGLRPRWQGRKRQLSVARPDPAGMR